MFGILSTTIYSTNESSWREHFAPGLCRKSEIILFECTSLITRQIAAFLRDQMIERGCTFWKEKNGVWVNASAKEARGENRPTSTWEAQK